MPRDELREDPVDQVRAFNRFWTRQIGVLQAGLLNTDFTLTEARVLFEIARAPSIDASTLRRELGLDAGYMSRVLGRLRRAGYVESSPAPADARRQLLRLTASGTSAFQDLDARSAREVKAMLEPLDGADRDRLLAAMAAIRRVLQPREPAAPYVIRPLRAGDLGWVVHRHGVLYSEEYGWDETFEGLVADVVARYGMSRDPRSESAWIAEREREPVGSVFCCRRDDQTAQLRLLLVEPSARGLGIGARLVDECVTFARRAGYQRMVLWTNDVLVSARRLYEAAGFTLVDSEPHHSFGRDLVGQNWELPLR